MAELAPDSQTQGGSKFMGHESEREVLSGAVAPREAADPTEVTTEVTPQPGETPAGPLPQWREAAAALVSWTPLGTHASALQPLRVWSRLCPLVRN